MTVDELRSLLASWTVHLRGQRKSPQTVKAYTTGVRMYLDWCAANRPHADGLDRRSESSGQNFLDRRRVNAWIAQLLDEGAEAATARARQLALRRFTAWLVDEDELDTDPLLGLKPPKLDTKVIPVLSDDEVARLVKACAGKTFRDRRDEALVRLMLETCLRAEEALSMTIPDTDLGEGKTVIRRGKGGKGRTVWFGPKTGMAIDRYLRLRRTHRLAGTPTLWLGDRGKTFAYHGLFDTLKMRARLAGVVDFHPHRLRHTGSSRWLDAGGSEGGLMAQNGWSRRDMLDRYTRSTSERRAGEEARRLNLGDTV